MLLLCVGKIRSPWIAAGCTEYLARLGTKISLRELPASREREASRQRDDESCRLLESARRERCSVLWVLDECGEGMSSTLFADSLRALDDRGVPLVFILGGAYGLSDAVRHQARRLMRLSDMTLPHELCRLVFLEQFYRAHEIIRGSGYHH